MSGGRLAAAGIEPAYSPARIQRADDVLDLLWGKVPAGTVLTLS